MINYHKIKYLSYITLNYSLFTLANKNNIRGMPPILLTTVSNPFGSSTLIELTITVDIT